jgi:pre-mRNA-splicing factor 38A
LTHVDEFVDDLLIKTRVCATTLPKINPRLFLEDEDRLEPRESALGEELEEMENEEEQSGDSYGEVEELNNGHVGRSERSETEEQVGDGDNRGDVEDLNNGHVGMSEHSASEDGEASE